MDLDAMTALSLLSHFSQIGSTIPDPRRDEVIKKLPALTEDDLSTLDQRDSCCPICFTPYLAILASEETALAMESPAFSTEDLGVTRLAETCGHVFCRKDIITWIRQHDTCPTCRRPFVKDSTTRTAVVGPENSGQDTENAFVLRLSPGPDPADPNAVWPTRLYTESHAPWSTSEDSTDSTSHPPERDDISRGDGRNQGHSEGHDEFIGMYS